MNRMLLINKAVRADITRAIAKAMDQVIPREMVEKIAMKKPVDILSLADRPTGFKRPQSPYVEIPNGYRAHISFEQQPIGVCKHLSVSVDTPGKLPSVIAVKTLMKEFGMTKEPMQSWLEEFDPGHHAVNVVTPA